MKEVIKQNLPTIMEKFDMHPLTDINCLETGDFIFIPDKESASKLKVTLETLRKWELSSTSSDNAYRYGCNAYGVVKSIFGNIDWYKFDPSDSKSHFLVVTRAEYSSQTDNNHNMEDESTITIENANSIKDCKVTVIKKHPPLTFLSAIPFRPFQPIYDIADDRCPHSRTKTVMTGAIDKLVNSFTGYGFPGYSGKCDIRHSLTMVETICNEYSTFRGLLGSKGILKEIDCNVNYSSRFRYPSRFLMANSNKLEYPQDFSRDTVTPYFRYGTNDELQMNAGFIRNITKRGVTLYRSKKLHDFADSIFAGAIALEMKNRYSKVIENAKSMITGLSDEIPIVEKLINKFEDVSKLMNLEEVGKLMGVDKNTISEMEKLV